MIKKAIAAAFVSAGLLVTVAPGAGAQPPAAACHGLHTAHMSVPHLNQGTATAHASIAHPDCPMM
jgi:hypothetical protein